jgi:hypothetical protein
MHADATPEQIIAAVKEAWLEIAPYFEVAHPERELPDIGVDQIESELRAQLRAARGPNAIISCYLPFDIVGFHQIVDRTVITQKLGRWDFELFGRREHAGTFEELDEEQTVAVNKHGLWHMMGRYNDKHELWVCVERGWPEYGHVYDLNDGSPFLPGRIVPDRTYETWLDFLIKLARR